MLYLLHTKDSFGYKILLMGIKISILLHFAKNVRETRKKRGLTQEQLAFKAGLHRTYVGMIERAEKNVTLINIEKIANALEVKIKDLMEFNNGK